MIQTPAPGVSVVIPTYNRAPLVGRAIQSVLQQTYQGFEVIVVDDASSDHTGEVIRGLGDPRIRCIRHGRNRGGSVARNTGIEASAAEYVAFLDSDDEWLPRKLEAQLAALSKGGSNVVMVYTGICFVNASGQVLRSRRARHAGKLDELLLERNVIGTTSSALIAKSALEDVGAFDERLPSRQDIDLWIRISRRGRIACVPEPLVLHYVHPQRITADPWAKVRAYELMLEKYRVDLSARPRAKALFLYRLGLWYMKLGERDKAERAIREALFVHPLAKVGAAWVLVKLGIRPQTLYRQLARIRNALGRREVG